MVSKTTKERRLEKEKAALEARLAAVEEEKAATEAKLAREKQETKRVSAKYVKSLATVGARKDSKVKKNLGMLMQIKKVTKKKVWQLVKFIGNDQQLREAAMMVLKALTMKDYTHVDGEDDTRRIKVDTLVEEWLAVYSTDVRAAINDQRSYVQSEMKRIALTYLKEGMAEGKTLPTPEEFELIAMRNLDDGHGNDVPDKVEIFDLYLMMVSCCSGTHTYGDKKRRSQLISLATTHEGKLAVPFSTEAMVMVMYQNCHQKWLNMHKRKEIDKIPGDIPKYSSKRHEETKMWMGKYSDSCSGNSPYGGWCTDGIKEFNRYRTQICDLRTDHFETIKKYEEDAMKRFYDAYITERKRKKKENGQPDDVEDAGSDQENSGKKQKTVDEEVFAAFDEEDV